MSEEDCEADVDKLTSVRRFVFSYSLPVDTHIASPVSIFSVYLRTGPHLHHSRVPKTYTNIDDTQQNFFSDHRFSLQILADHPDFQSSDAIAARKHSSNPVPPSHLANFRTQQKIYQFRDHRTSDHNSKISAPPIAFLHRRLHKTSDLLGTQLGWNQASKQTA